MLGAEVKKARLSAGLSQETAAKQIHKTKSWMSRVERGDIQPPMHTMRQLCTVIQLDPQILMRYLLAQEPPDEPLCRP